LGRVEVVQRSDVVPGDQRAWSRSPSERPKPPPPSLRTNAPPNPRCPPPTTRNAPPVRGHLDVVDSRRLVAVDVDDLFVEEILDQIQRLVVGWGQLRGKIRQNEFSAGVEVDDAADRREVAPTLALDDERVDLRETYRSVCSTTKSVDAADVEAGRPAASRTTGRPDHLREEPIMERHGGGLCVRPNGGHDQGHQRERHHAAVLPSIDPLVQVGECPASGRPAIVAIGGHDAVRFVGDQEQR